MWTYSQESNATVLWASTWYKAVFTLPLPTSILHSLFKSLQISSLLPRVLESRHFYFPIWLLLWSHSTPSFAANISIIISISEIKTNKNGFWGYSRRESPWFFLEKFCFSFMALREAKYSLIKLNILLYPTPLNSGCDQVGVFSLCSSISPPPNIPHPPAQGFLLIVLFKS